MRSFCVVDFPAPLGPRNPKISPRPTLKSMPRTAGSADLGYVYVSPSTRMTSVITRPAGTASAVSMSTPLGVRPCHRVRGIKFRPDFPERRESLY
jgi:hypothetical protein